MKKQLLKLYGSFTPPQVGVILDIVQLHSNKRMSIINKKIARLKAKEFVIGFITALILLGVFLLLLYVGFIHSFAKVLLAFFLTFIATFWLTVFLLQADTQKLEQLKEKKDAITTDAKALFQKNEALCRVLFFPKENFRSKLMKSVQSYGKDYRDTARAIFFSCNYFLNLNANK